MAHPKRREWAEELSRTLECPIYWDTNNTIWDTCKGAWRLADKTADYHCVIQDDAILSIGFKENAHQIARKILRECGKTAINFYFGERKLANKSTIEQSFKKGYMLQKFNAWGVAICLPTEWIDPMIRFGDGFYAWQDDTKIKHFLAKHGYKTAFTLPSLIDHKRMEINPTLTQSKDRDRFSPYFIDGAQEGEKKIPRIVHQIWIGDQSKIPQRLIDTWKMPGWEHRLWSEKEIDAFELKNRKLYDYFMGKKCYYGASDVVRVEILERLGGVYIDADTERLAPIDEIMEDCTFWSVWSNTEGRVANGVMAAIPEHPIIVNYREQMGLANVVEPVWSTIGGTLFSEMIFKHQDKKTKLMPPRTFYPFDSKGNVTLGRHKNYAKHYWGSTHKLYGKL